MSPNKSVAAESSEPSVGSQRPPRKTRRKRPTKKAPAEAAAVEDTTEASTGRRRRRRSRSEEGGTRQEDPREEGSATASTSSDRRAADADCRGPRRRPRTRKAAAEVNDGQEGRRREGRSQGCTRGRPSGGPRRRGRSERRARRRPVRRRGDRDRPRARRRCPEPGGRQHRAGQRGVPGGRARGGPGQGPRGGQGRGGRPPPAAVADSTETEAFEISDADIEDEPQQQVTVAGATADPVKDYLKQIGKVALLNAEQEVELAKRIEAGLFAEEKLNSGDDAGPEAAPRPRVDRRGRPARQEPPARGQPAPRGRRWPSATPAAACCSWT